MKKRPLTIGAAAVAALVTVTACSNTSNPQQAHSTTPANVTSSSSVAAPSEAHNQADVTFAQQMIPHHGQAVQMSDMLLGKQGIDPRVSALANQIKAEQAPEIQTMQSWLNAWGQSSTPSTSPSMDMPGMPGMPGMPDHGAMPGMSGSGMMSDQDMAALQNAQGLEASKLFLTQMITHHQGAIAMAQTEINTGQYPPAVALAHSIVTSQQQEINTMQSMLGSL
jgi:uncharacterized protein (DUF305 family)